MAMGYDLNEGQMKQAGSMFGIQQDYAPNKIKPSTAVEAAKETFGASHRLADRVIAIVARIAGHTPPVDEAKAVPQRSPTASSKRSRTAPIRLRDLCSAPTKPLIGWSANYHDRPLRLRARHPS